MESTAGRGEKIYPLRRIYFYLTEGCNLACRHCWIDPSYQHADKVYPSLPLNLFRSIIDQAIPLGLTNIKLTGGEPFLHPQIFEILELIRSKKLKLEIETNGVLCTPELVSSIARCEMPMISVSIDGADAKTHEWIRGVPGCFEDTLKGLSYLVEADLKPQIIMTLMKKNRDQIEKMVRLGESMGADSIKLNILQPMARGDSMHKEGEGLSVQELMDIGKWIEEILAKSTSIKILYDLPLAFMPLSCMFGDEGSGCGVCKIQEILGVLADGSYALCGIGRNIPELTFGHAAYDNLEDIWRNSEVLRQIRNGLPNRLKGICGKCLMKNICRGSCIAQNYYRNKDLWAPFWYCDEAYREGIFPEGRYV
ncbi:MAG: SynChlorMet cassette radical SAM/SPASM protein ScmF [Methanotrichaceae archaeon]|nr:SynChlorMet cassette radical SAM/SPASM protein ScmF [Methanotrichaceae archaeon]